MLQDFFKDLTLPSFLQSAFEKEEWYLVTAQLIEILNNSITQTELNSGDETLKITGKVHIGSNCTIGQYVVIDGPAYIDDDVEIGPHAFIRPGTVILKGCSIGHAAEIKNSIMMEGAKIANHCFLGDSIIGKKARLGGHSETANRRFDQQPIEFTYRDFKIQTQMPKLGLVLGDGSRLGGGVFTAPGTMIGYNCFISTMAFVSGYVPPGKFIKVQMETDMIDNRFSKELEHSKLFERV